MKTLATLILAALLSGCASMHGCDAGIGFGGPHVHCDQDPPAATAPAPKS